MGLGWLLQCLPLPLPYPPPQSALASSLCISKLPFSPSVSLFGWQRDGTDGRTDGLREGRGPRERRNGSVKARYVSFALRRTDGPRQRGKGKGDIYRIVLSATLSPSPLLVFVRTVASPPPLFSNSRLANPPPHQNTQSENEGHREGRETDRVHVWWWPLPLSPLSSLFQRLEGGGWMAAASSSLSFRFRFRS